MVFFIMIKFSFNISELWNGLLIRENFFSFMRIEKLEIWMKETTKKQFSKIEKNG